MKKFLFIVFLFGVSYTAFAQTGTPIPAATPAAVAAAPSAFKAWLALLGGLIPAVSAIVVVLNSFLSFLAQSFSKLQIAEPKWLQAIGNFMSPIVAFISANVPTAPQNQPSSTSQAAPPASS